MISRILVCVFVGQSSVGRSSVGNIGRSLCSDRRMFCQCHCGECVDHFGDLFVIAMNVRRVWH